MIPKAEVTYDAKEDIWTVEEDWFLDYAGVQDCIHKGFKSDLASVPRFFWRLITPYELSVEAALAHDYGYRNLGKFGDKILTRAEVDELLYKIAREQGVPWWRAKAAYWAVRGFAWATWRKYENNSDNPSSTVGELYND